MEYDEIVKAMVEDGARTKRQREVESAFGQRLPAVLRELDDNCGSRSEVLRRINNALEANGIQRKVSRGTLYNWCDDMVDG
jgi:hypothetical protein